MYENISFESLLNGMLSKIPDSIDKREGSIIYDALAPAAAELKQMYIELDALLDETFADTASWDFLVRRVAERGIYPKNATNTILKGVFNIDIPINSRFSLDEYNYIAIEKIDDCVYKLKCETSGANGNFHLGNIIPIDYIEGLTLAKLTEVLIPGEDEESLDDLRYRYFSSLESEAFGGNVTDYKEKTDDIDGVGGVKVYPAFYGGGSVKLVIINSQYKKPSEELINTVQTIIDPSVNQGEGLGLAPIGHVVSVEGAIEQILDINTTITYQVGWSFDEVKGSIEKAIDEYFNELSKAWADESNLVVRISQIETRLLNIKGIIDISKTSINNKEENFILGENSIPIRGTINSSDNIENLGELDNV